MKAAILFGLLLLAGTNSVHGQTSNPELYFTINGNTYIPRNVPTKGMYPVFWFDKDSQPKVQLGGIGAGTSLLYTVAPKLTLKGQVNISRHTYWDEPEILLSADWGYKIGEHYPHTTDYTTGLAATAQYPLGKRFSIGTGLGAQVLLLSNTRRSNITGSNSEPDDLQVPNKYYRTLMPVVPAELSYRTNNLLLSLRYEHALLNRYKNELANAREDRYSLLTFEVGFNLHINDPEYKKARKEAKETRRKNRKTIGPTF